MVYLMINAPRAINKWIETEANQTQRHERASPCVKTYLNSRESN